MNSQNEIILINLLNKYHSADNNLLFFALFNKTRLNLLIFNGWY